jgi:hypothetical protein
VEQIETNTTQNISDFRKNSKEWCEQRIKIVSREKELRAQIEVCAALASTPERRGIPVIDLSEPVRFKKVVPIITDHAMVRFLERRYDFDFKKLKADLLTEPVKMACRMGAQSVKAHGGRWTIRGGVLRLSSQRDAFSENGIPASFKRTTSSGDSNHRLMVTG